MSLNLVDHVGLLERVDCPDAAMEVYRVKVDHPAFQYISHVSMSIEAMTRTISQVKDMAFPDDGYLGLAAVGFSGIFRVQMYNLVDAALSENSTGHLWAPIEWRAHERRHQQWASALRPWLRYTLRVGFIDLYEKNKRRVNRHGGEAGRLARVVRDSCAHGGIIQANTLREPVSYHGIKIRNEAHGGELEHVFDYGDYLVLALAMFGQSADTADSVCT